MYAAVEVGALDKILLQKVFKFWVKGDRLVKQRIAPRNVGADADQVA